MCNTSFDGIMTGKYIYGIILVIDGHLKVKRSKSSFFNKYKSYLFLVRFWLDNMFMALFWLYNVRSKVKSH